MEGTLNAGGNTIGARAIFVLRGTTFFGFSDVALNKAPPVRGRDEGGGDDRPRTAPRRPWAARAWLARRTPATGACARVAAPDPGYHRPP